MAIREQKPWTLPRSSFYKTASLPHPQLSLAASSARLEASSVPIHCLTSKESENGSMAGLTFWRISGTVWVAQEGKRPGFGFSHYQWLAVDPWPMTFSPFIRIVSISKKTQAQSPVSLSHGRLHWLLSPVSTSSSYSLVSKQKRSLWDPVKSTAYSNPGIVLFKKRGRILVKIMKSMAL